MPQRSRRKSPAPSATALAARVDTLDKQLVEEGVRWIRRKLAETLFKGLSEIGIYVLDKFFGGDAERARSKARTKNASFRSLVKRCESTDLPISRSALQRAVWVAVMLRALPRHATAYPRLPPAHQVALLPLREPVTVERLAERALAKGWSVRALREVVVKEVAGTPRSGRKRGPRPKPFLLKALERSRSFFTLEGSRRSFTRAHLAALNDEQVELALENAHALVDSLRHLIVKLADRA